MRWLLLAFLPNFVTATVSFDYGFAQIVACTGVAVEVTWTGYHNIQEVNTATCNSGDVGPQPLEAYRSASDPSVTYSNDELSAAPGTTRYFQCDLHCGNGARFEVSCPSSCSATTNPSDDGSNGAFYCLNGVVGGTPGSCTCTCTAGYEGTNCETNTNECLSEINWTQIGQAFDPAGFGGTSIQLNFDGTVLAIGYWNDGASDDGKVEVYDWDGSTWVARPTISYSESGENFGKVVAISDDGNVVAASGPFFDGVNSNTGVIRIYEYNGSVWTKLGQDLIGQENDNVVKVVSLNAAGTRVAFSSELNDDCGGYGCGSVHVYEYDGSTAWNQLGLDLDGTNINDRYGTSLILNAAGDRIIIGTPAHEDNWATGPWSYGHIQVFEWNGVSWDQMGLDLDGEFPEDAFGTTVAMSSDGSIIAVGAVEHKIDDAGGTERNVGTVYVYEWNGAAWQQQAEIEGIFLWTGPDNFSQDMYHGEGLSLSDDGKMLAISATGYGMNDGYVKTYKYEDGAWSTIGQQLEVDDVDNFGTNIAMSGDGSKLTSVGESNVGNGDKVRVWDSVPASPCQNGGVCSQTSDGTTPALDSFYCDCTGTGYDGTVCLDDFDECAANGGLGACVNGAVCSDSLSDPTIAIGVYQCNCPAGWQGPNCDQDVDECAGGPNGPCLYGTCTNMFNNYTCTCNTTFTGRDCDECGLGSGYVLDGSTHTCVACVEPQVSGVTTWSTPCDDLLCAEGYGLNSQISTPEFTFTFDTADSSDNSGNCRRCPAGTESAISNSDCTLCAAGFEGADCTRDINECLPSNCRRADSSCIAVNSGDETTTLVGHNDYTGTVTIADVEAASLFVSIGYYQADQPFLFILNDGGGHTKSLAYQYDAAKNLCATIGCSHFWLDAKSWQTGFSMYWGFHTNFNCQYSETVSQGFYASDFMLTWFDPVACSAEVCQNSATCTETSDGTTPGAGVYHCACEPGYSGTHCDTADQCTASAVADDDGSTGVFFCTNGVVNGTTGACTCTCNPGYGGTGCDYAYPCTASSNPADDGSDGVLFCINGGTVTGNTPNCGCDCVSAPGWQNIGCSESINDCVGQLCENGATCVDGHMLYSCDCVTGWDGNLCQNDINECDADPCVRGNCTESTTDVNVPVGSFSCACPGEYTGYDCDTLPTKKTKRLRSVAEDYTTVSYIAMGSAVLVFATWGVVARSPSQNLTYFLQKGENPREPFLRRIYKWLTKNLQNNKTARRVERFILTKP